MTNQTKGKKVVEAIKKKWNSAVEMISKPLGRAIKKRSRQGGQNYCSRPSGGIEEPAHHYIDADVNFTEIPPEKFVEAENQDDITLPCNVYEAEGLQLFKNIEKGKLIPTDVYIRHIRLSGSNATKTLIWTDKRLVIISPKMKIKWQKKWDKIQGLPRLYCSNKEGVEQQLTINYKKPESVFAPHWNYETMKLESRREVFGIMLQVKPGQPEVDKFFKENNLIRYCSPDLE